MRAVILAGGKGRRLKPYTAVFPKPLMPLGDRPILEIVVGQLREAGFDDLTFAVGHLAGLIQAYFGDGSRFGVRIEYSLEDEPLGTAGPLSLIRPPTDDFLVMNGDLLTDLDFRQFLAAHRSSGAVATLAVYRKSVDITLGVLDLDAQDRVVGYTEKPTLHYLVSSGIYCFKPAILSRLPRGTRRDLPELVLELIAAGEPVHGHRFGGYWLDIGRPEDYEVALAEVAKGRFE
ncbi:MAG: NTP transferase domain-containing protein [Myxococcales bacterium]|nr:NTP transferase domain-containing protein [Myxococcales bacterium]